MQGAGGDGADFVAGLVGGKAAAEIRGEVPRVSRVAGGDGKEGCFREGPGFGGEKVSGGGEKVFSFPKAFQFAGQGGAELVAGLVVREAGDEGADEADLF